MVRHEKKEKWMTEQPTLKQPDGTSYLNNRLGDEPQEGRGECYGHHRNSEVFTMDEEEIYWADGEGCDGTKE